MDSYVVFVENDGSGLYHKYGCDDFAQTSFWGIQPQARRGKRLQALPALLRLNQKYTDCLPHPQSPRVRRGSEMRYL